MLYLGDKAVGDMSDLPQLVGLGATPAELEAALALLKKVTAEVAGHPVYAVEVYGNTTDIRLLPVGSDDWRTGNRTTENILLIPGPMFVELNAALALAQRVPLSQDGKGRLGTGAQVAAKLQEGIAALLPLVDVARAGAAPPRKMSTGAKVAIGVGVAAVLGLGVWAVARR